MKLILSSMVTKPAIKPVADSSSKESEKMWQMWYNSNMVCISNRGAMRNRLLFYKILRLLLLCTVASSKNQDRIFEMIINVWSTTTPFNNPHSFPNYWKIYWVCLLRSVKNRRQCVEQILVRRMVGLSSSKLITFYAFKSCLLCIMHGMTKKFQILVDLPPGKYLNSPKNSLHFLKKSWKALCVLLIEKRFFLCIFFAAFTRNADI